MYLLDLYCVTLQEIMSTKSSILIQTLFLLLHIQAVLDKRQAMVVEGAQPKRKLARDLEIEMGED